MYIKRELEKDIKKVLDDKEIIAIFGPRQCGKSTLINHILKTKKNVNSISFDDFKIKLLFENDIDSFIDVHVKPYKTLFIDEVQYVKKSGQKLKYIYDNYKIKIIISGSSSTELSIQSIKYLVGRIFVFNLYPFSFNEFLLSKDEILYKLYKKNKFGDEINEQLQNYIEEFIIYGGYPRVVLEKNKDKKKLILNNIYNTYLLKEIRDILGLSDNDKLVLLLKALSLQLGNLINYNELSSITGLSYINLQKYLKILEHTYICKRCSTFHSNKRTELVKTPKIYFFDYGFRNICIDNFNYNRTDKGLLYENLIYIESLKKGIELKYWRKKSGVEVDFINNGVPIEIKSMPKISRSFMQFYLDYKPTLGYILSPKISKEITKNGLKIKQLSFSQYLANY